MQASNADHVSQQLEALRAQLAEAQETIRAIRAGEIDALLMSGRQGGQVFALENADRPYRVLVEAMQEGAATLLSNGMLLYANRRFAEMLKVPLDKIFGTPLHKFMVFSDKVAFADLLAASATNGVHGEVTFCASDGTLIPVSVALNPLSLEDVQAVSMIATDLTQQKRREDEILLLQGLQLSVSEASDVRSALDIVLSNIGQSKPSIYGEAWTLGADRATLECSATWSVERHRYHDFATTHEGQQFSIDSGLIGSAWKEKTIVVVPDLQMDSRFTRAAAAVKVGLKTGLVIPIVVGEATVAVLGFYSTRDDDFDAHFVRLVSAVAGQLGSFIQRKLAEEALVKAHRELEARVVERTAELSRINAVLQTEVEERTRIATRISRLQDVIIAFAASLTLDEVANDIRHHALDGIGAEAGGLLLLDKSGKHLRLLVSKGYPPALVEAWQDVSVDTISPVVAQCVRDKEAIWHQPYYDAIGDIAADGSGLHDQALGAWAVIPLTVGERVVGVLGLSFPENHPVGDDMRTFVLALAEQCAQAIERAHLFEAEAKARQEAEHANQLKLTFLAMVSHELRTPLTSIKGFLSTLLADDVTWRPEQQRDFLMTAEAEADKLTSLVEQLLDLSRMQAGSMQIYPRSCPFTEILKIATAEIEALTELHHLVIVPAGLDTLVLADQDRIAQVLANLVGNAAKYSLPGTTITLSAERIGKYLQVAVADEGQGIPLEDHERIFEAFRQLTQQDGLSRRQGAGLGLAICKGLIEAHGGRIWIDPAYRGGTKVNFTLPCA